ncbi:outer membrane immunogenic protein [Bradyrhizobium lablabi]|uniref:Outer membrane immunogenic protein n=1 Tax=Bradyrhizobium lablabi TaxID=722472 RepID=A0A1M7FBQ5_9BRAD|nr:outer membrane beta-barrel protein [Bradyrhizobium lablabi]SHM01440.1 outer membrane immunogenic protein [Bradyrhizobium lablabi]
MKKFLLGTVGLLALGLAAPASAADLAARPYTKAPPIVTAPFYDWSGFYIGLNGGGGWSHKCWDLTNVTGIPVSPSVAEGCHNATGGLVGGQIGYRWMSGPVVFGLEAQGDWADLKGSNPSSLAALTPLLTNQTKIDAIGLFTGQVGYAWNNVLWYLKGGGAVTHDKYTGFLTGAGIVLDQASETRWGGTVGTGVEFGFAPNWSVGVEYDHLFMGNRSITFPTTVFVGSRVDSIKQDVDMATVRVNYRFGGPVVARY